MSHAFTLPAGLNPGTVSTAAPAEPWPALRDDLQLHHGPADRNGQPTWTLHDPVRHRFLRLDWQSHEVLRRWWLADAALIAEQVNCQTTLAISDDHVRQVLAWARQEELLLATTPPPATRRPTGGEGEDGGLGTWLLHHYLFFRVPLFNPDRLLGHLLPLLRGLGSTAFTRLSLAVLLLGLAGLLRNVDALHAQWLDLLSWRGLALYATTLVGVKVAHEFGHALVAKHHGLRVPTMGVAFLVMWPVAYTDTSEAWRLADARARLAIAAAGVRTELTLAAWATLAWVLLPEGGARTAAFIIATMTWVSTLAINLSPFMRFDGYFLLSDALDMPNLHDRAFALARWQLRRQLLGWQAPVPETFSPARTRGLIAFAWATWVYRLALYLGIAWMVYHFAFPALGLLLFAVELGWFIVAPLQREGRIWARGWSAWRGARRWRISLLALALLGSLALWPWPARETAAAVLMPAQELPVRLPAAASLQTLPPAEGTPVRAGTVLLEAAVPALQQRLASTEVRVQQLERQVGMASLSGEQQAQWQTLRAALATSRDEAAALRQDLARYAPVAPFDGVVVGRDPALLPGGVVGPQQTLLRIASAGPGRVLAYVSEGVAARLHAGDAAAFTADAAPLQRWPARVLSVSPHAVSSLGEPMLARAHGGPVEAREQQGRWLPLEPLYRVELQLEADTGLSARRWRGHLVVEREPRSLWERAQRAAGEVLAREAGF